MENDKVEKMNPVPPFVKFVCANVPMAFDDSLSYYEALCAMWKYLDNVVNVVNNNATITEEQLAAYKELESFVTNYFENLDVQQEINEKLDQMAEDGSLTALIADYMNPYIEEQNTTLQNAINTQNGRITAIENEVESIASGTPKFVASTDDMTDTSIAYVNTTDGYLYTYDNGAWTAQFIYQATGVSDGSITKGKFAKFALEVSKDRAKKDFLDKINTVPDIDFVINGYNASGYQTGYSSATRLCTKFYVNISSDVLFGRLSDDYEYFVNIYTKVNKTADAIDFSGIDFEGGFINSAGSLVTGNNCIRTDDYFEVSGNTSLELDKLMLDIRLVEYDKVTSEIHAIYQSTFNGSNLPANLSGDYKYKLAVKCGDINLPEQYTMADLLGVINASYTTTMYAQLNGSGWKTANMSIDATTYANKLFTMTLKKTDGSLCEPYAVIFSSDLRTPLANKKISILGDSFSAFTGQIPEGNNPYYNGSNAGVSNYHQMWWARLIEENGAKQGVIEAWSGSNVSSIRTGSGTPMSDTSRCENLGNPDVVIIMGGTNDFSHTPSLLGDYNGTQTFPTTTTNFADAYAVMLSRITSTYPNATVFCCGIPLFVRTNTNKDECERNTETDGTRKTIFQYSEKIREIAHIMNCQYIDLNECGFNRENYYNTYCQDNATTPTHPNAKGQEVLYKCIEKKVIEVLNNLK